ncbi:MAG: NAD(P)/FAD-dependent oxidoreductase [bacterium]
MANPVEYDVLVVGAGPAGLSAGFAAARSGARVAIFEKSKEIGCPIHTSGGSWIEELNQLGIPDRFMHPISEGIFISPNARAVFEYQYPPSCVVDVRGLYQYLAEIASAEGAEIFVNSNVVDLDCRDDRISGLMVRQRASECLYRSSLVIDASGTSGLIARKVGLSRGFSTMGVGAEYDLYAPKWPENRVAFMFGRQVAPSGYAWIFPHRENRIRLGVGVVSADEKTDPRVYLDRILDTGAFFREELAKVSQIEYHTGIIPSEIHLHETTADGLLVVGDAAGLVSTLLGEGIRYAIDIGRIAGNVAGEAVAAHRFDKKFLKRYERRWKKKYSRAFNFGVFANKRLRQYTDSQWDQKVRLLSELTPEFIPPILKGDFTLNFAMRLAVHHPGLLRTGGLSFLKSLFKA